MGQILLFAVLGLGAGALSAALGLGVVLTWRGSGVVNLAAGAMAMFIAYVYWDLRTRGILFLPPFHLQLRAGAIGTVPAFAMSMAVAAALGALLYSIVFRPLRQAPPLAKVIASAGVLLTLQAVVVLEFGTTSKSVPDILPNGPNDVITVLGINVPVNRFVLAAVAIALAVSLWAFFRFSRFGLSTAAAAENEKAATLAGLSPNMLGLLNWVAGSVVAGAVGVLAAPVTQLDPTVLTLAVIPALGAALVGRLESFVVTAAAGLLIGIGQSILTYCQTLSWYPQSDGLPIPGLSAGVPFLVIVVVMYFRGRSLPTRGSVEAPRFPPAPRPDRLWLRVPGPALAAAIGIVALSPVWRQAAINSLIGAVVCLSLVVITGYLGQTSLLHMALAGTSGFVLARLATSAGLNFPLGVLIAVGASCLLGFVAAIPALRVQGVNLAIVSLAAAEAIQEIYFRNPSWAGGDAGANVPPPRLGPLRFGPADAFPLGNNKLPSASFGLFCLVVVTAVGLGVVALRRHTLGQRMLAVRANERAAASLGINVPATKTIGFVISAGIAGIAGVLYAYNFGSVTYTRFDAMTAVAFLAFAYLGGITTVTGAIVGGILVTQGIGFLSMREWFGLSDNYTLLVAGLAVIVTVVLNPNGISGAARATIGSLPRPHRKHVDSRPTTDVPQGAGVGGTTLAGDRA